jgi:hypothetical protein
MKKLYFFQYLIQHLQYSNNQKKRQNPNTVKPVYLEHVDNWLLKLDLCYFNRYVFNNHLSTCLIQTGFTVYDEFFLLRLYFTFKL